MLKRISVFLSMLMLMGGFLQAQVTTSTITGNVKTVGGESLVGATITATHTPSGSVYNTIAKKDGFFTLPGLRVGGPYTVKIEFVGQESKVFEGIILQLGEPYTIDVVLGETTKELEGVTVTGKIRRTASDKGGMSTVLNNRVLTTMPTISRSITDFTRLTPQAKGNSFGGRDYRSNNITVDGANLNNNFGLTDDPLPGSGNSPVSLDAFDEISVSVSPFDVKQGNFTGGNIAAITKSGTNTFKGTAYYYFRNEKFIGDKVKDQKALKPAGKTTIFGGSIGGPIIKNKLFFFVNAEKETKPPAAGITWTPTGGSGQGNVSDVTKADLDLVANYVKGMGYDPGVYDNFPSFKNENYKILGKLDWNINNKHKLTLKYSDFKGTQDFGPSQSGNVGGTQSGLTYGPKFSKTAMGFSSTIYQQIDVVKSGALELNSNFSPRLSNQFLATITQIKSDKEGQGDPFPFVDIFKVVGSNSQNYISLGTEPFNGRNNKVLNDIYTITNNLTFYAGKHTLTAGVSYEYQKVGNMFMRGANGYYAFASVSDFVNNRAPIKFAQTYSLIDGKDAIFSAELKIGQLAAYVQDEINFNPKFKLTLGLRVDKPVYPEQPLENPANSALTFQDVNGNPLKITTGQFPKASPLFSPRVGFRWDLYGNKSLIVRGGTGIFTGRIPFVYLTNIPTNSGMYQYSSNVNIGSAGVNMNNYLFSSNTTEYNPFYNNSLPANYFPTTAGSVASADFAVTAKKFKFPQIWRTNLAVDQSFGQGWLVSIEAMYTKDINATAMFNANQSQPTSTVTTGGFVRPAFAANNNASRRVNTGITNAIVLDNTKKGQSFILTAQLSKAFSNGFYGSVAYNYTFSQDVTANPGSQASSVWNANPTSGTLNDRELSYSRYAVPHRVIANVSYRKEYLKHLGTTISFFFEGTYQDRYNILYNGDINWDGYAQDLLYVPTNATDPSQIRFIASKTYGNGVTYTGAQLAQIFEEYIAQDPYLSKTRGQVVERYGAKAPWYNKVDARIAQDVFVNIGKRKHTLQVTADVFNVGNLLNKNWGVRRQTTITNPLVVENVTGGVPTFSVAPFNNAPVTKSFMNNVSTLSTWSMQMGIRYIF
jgi:outer membrane receptor protein involved in Fe transport